MRYSIMHETVYDYREPVSLSQQSLHLTPRVAERQRCIEHSLAITPEPAHRIDRIDNFGNPVSVLEFDRPHRRLGIIAQTVIEVSARVSNPATQTSDPWESVASRFEYRAGRPLSASCLRAAMFRVESPFVRVKSVLGDYARECFPLGRPLIEGSFALMRKIHREFTFDPDATHIATPMLDVLKKKRGVCQDYAHIMLGCLRSLGLPARYVSGYLLTRPPPGKPRLVGADASHAWIEIYLPEDGWIAFDPTNNVIPDTEHITLAWGRDFGDVSPQRGVILGGGKHQIKVSVTVAPLDAAVAE